MFTLVLAVRELLILASILFADEASILPSDPLFYLHHGNLDRIWWKWQNANPSARMYAVSGNTNSTSPSTSPQLTLDFLMPFTTLSAPVKVEDVMDTTSAPWCFTYDY